MTSKPLFAVRPTGKRCAIYTRKSIQPPILQEITSLDSQRAICASYIASQQHKDWHELAKHYDDAGKSGSTLERPALQDLLADIEAGLVDVVLVYKLDRITRTLLDFVRLIDFFESYGVVFVSITQNFDTSDSMGRLIRNILLTFAQFEREIATDRMRDKVRVMKERGLWTGGVAPYGYDLKRGKLVVNSAEAAGVRCIFETYGAEQRLLGVYHRMVELGFRQKVWRSKGGTVYGGAPVSTSTINHVLRNPIYIGQVRHRDQCYQGIHEPIIEKALWNSIQVILAKRSIFRPLQPSNLLTGLLVDGVGRSMAVHFGRNRYKKFRYYQSRRTAWALRQKVKPVHTNADRLERLVLETLKSFLADRRRLRVALTDWHAGEADLDRLAAKGGEAAARLGRLTVRQLSCALRALVRRIEVHPDFVRMLVRLDAVPSFIRWDGSGLFALGQLDMMRAKAFHVIDIPVVVSHEHRKHNLPISEQRPANGKRADRGLVRLLAEAREAQRMVFDHRDTPISELARSVRRKGLSFSRLVRLNYLAPDIVASFMDGAQPAGLTRGVLMDMDLPVDWILQRRLLGYPPRSQSELPSISLEHSAQV